MARLKQPPRAKKRRDSIIKMLREEAGLKQETVAKRLNLSVSQFSRIERDLGKARVAQLIVLSSILGVPPGMLLGDSAAFKGKTGIGAARLYRAVPILSIDELGRRRGMLQVADRQYVAPTMEVSDDAFAIELTDGLHAGDKLVCDPHAALKMGDVVVVEINGTGEIVVGAYQPYHASNPEAPGFSVKPLNAQADVVRCGKSNPATVLATAVELHIDLRRKGIAPLL